MNELYEPNSALFGVLVARPGASSTSFAPATDSTAKFGKVALTLLGAALLPCLWWVTVS